MHGGKSNGEIEKHQYCQYQSAIENNAIFSNESERENL